MLNIKVIRPSKSRHRSTAFIVRKHSESKEKKQELFIIAEDLMIIRMKIVINYLMIYKLSNDTLIHSKNRNEHRKNLEIIL